MATTGATHEEVASTASTVGDGAAEGKYEAPQDSAPEEVDHDDAPICGCIPHLWYATNIPLPVQFLLIASYAKYK